MTHRTGGGSGLANGSGIGPPWGQVRLEFSRSLMNLNRVRLISNDVLPCVWGGVGVGGRFFFLRGGRGQGLQSPWSLGFLAPPREKKINTVSGEVWGVEEGGKGSKDPKDSGLQWLWTP